MTAASPKTIVKVSKFRTGASRRSSPQGSQIQPLEGRTFFSAFPGAVGFGAAATGGQGGSTYVVTNLNDSGAGSFRDAVSKSGRIVNFAVGGNINLLSPVSVNSNVTIDGTNAPGQGIAIQGREISFSGKQNDIVRYVRIRQGAADPDTGKSSINMGSSSNMIFDHVSIEFGSWDNIDAVGATNVTFQNCIIADPIGQQFNAHTEGSNFTWYNNIFAEAHNRSPLTKGNTQFVNNLVYNFQAGYTAGNTSGHFSHDIINNYFITGPSTTNASDAFYQLANQSIYARGNMLDKNNDGTLNGSTVTPGGVTVLTTPWSSTTSSLPTTSAAAAYAYDIVNAGDSIHYDAVDQQVLNDIKSLGKLGKLWTAATQTTTFTYGGYGLIAPISTGTHTVANLASSLLLDDPASSTANGTQMIQYTANGGWNQNWVFTLTANGYYTITNGSSGKALDDPASSPASGVKLQQYTLSGANNQLWSLIPKGNGFVIKNKATGLVIDNPGSSTAAGGLIDLASETDTTNQMWQLT